MKFHLELDCDHPAFGGNSIHCTDEICRRLREAADQIEQAVDLDQIEGKDLLAAMSERWERVASSFRNYRLYKSPLPSKGNRWTVISYWLDGKWYLRDDATEEPPGRLSREDVIEWFWNKLCDPPAKAWDRWNRVWQPEQQLAIWRRQQKANPDGPVDENGQPIINADGTRRRWGWKIE